MDTDQAARTEVEAPKKSHGRAGRDLVAAIAVGVILFALIIGSLYIRPELFVGLVAIAAVLGLYELAQGFAKQDRNIALIPLWVGAVGMAVSAWLGGGDALLLSFVLTVGTATVWRIFDGGGISAVRDISASTFAAAYIPLLLGFAILTLRDFGPTAVFTIVLIVFGNDTGGYVAGVLFGKHKMVPSISPKKSWEGLAGSFILTLIIAFIMMLVFLGGEWWLAILLAIAGVIMSTLGDLSASLMKRDLGLKDFGTLLPGHGGMLDRLDSVLFAAPTSYAIFLLMA